MLLKAEVMIHSPAMPPYRQELATDAISIGRASECTIPIKDRYLSRKHAEIAARNGGWILRDCGSANGTYLNGVRVAEDRPLHTGDRIRIGDTEMLFEIAEHSTDRILAIADTAAKTTIALPVHEITRRGYDTGDLERLHTLNQLAADLIEDRPLDQLFGFIAERVLLHTRASRSAIGLLGSDGHSFANVEVRRQERTDTSEVRISRTVMASVVQEKKALAFMDIGTDERLSQRASIMTQGIRSILCAPLLIADSVVGVLYVDYRVDRAISEEDVRLVAQIARFAAMKLETTRLREQSIEKRMLDEELKMASLIQRRLLPAPPAGIDGFTFAGANRPCRTVSGDYYDFVMRPDGRLYFAIADVSGKGVTAGLMMAGLQASFRIFCKSDPSPAQLLGQLNAALKENLPQSKFITLFAGRLDTKSGLVEYANAGHTPPLWLRPTRVDELTDSDVVLGIVGEAEFSDHTLALAHGDALVLFTDGLSDAENAKGEELITAKLANRVQSLHGSTADAVIAAVDAVVTEHVGDEPLTDDVTVVVVSRSMNDE